jgi:hypothetical protein
MIVWGIRSRGRALGQLRYPCPKCQQTAFHTVVRTQRKFALFWIPLFPIGSSTASTCNVCGFRQGLKNAQADEMLAQAAATAPRIEP